MRCTIRISENVSCNANAPALLPIQLPSRADYSSNASAASSVDVCSPCFCLMLAGDSDVLQEVTFMDEICGVRCYSPQLATAAGEMLQPRLQVQVHSTMPVDSAVK